MGDMADLDRDDYFYALGAGTLEEQEEEIELGKDFIMAPRKSVAKKTRKVKKPILIKVGNSLVDPTDVSCITKIKSKTNLYVVRLKSQPNMNFPIWANKADIQALLSYFEMEFGDNEEG